MLLFIMVIDILRYVILTSEQSFKIGAIPQRKIKVTQYYFQDSTG